jgi:UDP-glucose 4-epimerase
MRRENPSVNRSSSKCTTTDVILDGGAAMSDDTMTNAAISSSSSSSRVAAIYQDTVTKGNGKTRNSVSTTPTNAAAVVAAAAGNGSGVGGKSNSTKLSSSNMKLSNALMILCFSVFSLCIFQTLVTNVYYDSDSFMEIPAKPSFHAAPNDNAPILRQTSQLVRSTETNLPPTVARPSLSTTTTTPTILVTGGCGYIGSHTIVLLLQEGYNVVVVDNLINSSPVSLDRVAAIVGLSDEERNVRLVLHSIDICNEADLRQIFSQSLPFHSVIHFAGLKAVGESTRMPLRYYENNLIGTFILLRLMDEYDCHSIVFSSSATVYGDVDRMPITEDTPTGIGITNAYGRTKYMIEQILQDFYHSKTLDNSNATTTDWSITILRYFNPVGAHPSGMIGEDPHGIPNNLMPYVAQVAVGRREFLTIFGNDYPTKDGTGVRDYLHVMDLAEGHVSALHYMDKKETGLFTFNLGTGNGYSVLEMCAAMGKACGHEIKYQIGERRPGDIATCYADPTKAEVEMGWKAKLDLNVMCHDLWNWQSNNPNGYNKEDNDASTTGSKMRMLLSRLGSSKKKESRNRI